MKINLIKVLFATTLLGTMGFSYASKGTGFRLIVVNHLNENSAADGLDPSYWPALNVEIYPEYSSSPCFNGPIKMGPYNVKDNTIRVPINESFKECKSFARIKVSTIPLPDGQKPYNDPLFALRWDEFPEPKNYSTYIVTINQGQKPIHKDHTYKDGTIKLEVTGEG